MAACRCSDNIILFISLSPSFSLCLPPYLTPHPHSAFLWVLAYFSPVRRVSLCCGGDGCRQLQLKPAPFVIPGRESIFSRSFGRNTLGRPLGCGAGRLWQGFVNYMDWGCWGDNIYILHRAERCHLMIENYILLFKGKVQCILIALSKYNSCTTQLTHLKCTIQ